MLNKRLLRKVRNRIAEIPESYDQGKFRTYREESPCGVAACLAGETIICSARSVKTGIRSLWEAESVSLTAQELLGLNFDSAHQMYGHKYEVQELEGN